MTRVADRTGLGRVVLALCALAAVSMVWYGIDRSVQCAWATLALAVIYNLVYMGYWWKWRKGQSA